MEDGRLVRQQLLHLAVASRIQDVCTLSRGGKWLEQASELCQFNQSILIWQADLLRPLRVRKNVVRYTGSVYSCKHKLNG